MTGRTPEGKVQDAILKKLRSIPLSDWTKATITNKVGSPDISGDIQGLAIYIEVKKNEKEKLRPAQIYRIDKALQRKAIAFGTYSWEDCRIKLHSALRAKGIYVQL